MIISTSAAMGLLIRFCQYWLVRHIGRNHILFGTILISGIAFVFIPFNTNLIILFILAAFMGIGLNLGQPLSMVYAMKFSATQRHGEVLGIRISINRGSQFAAIMLLTLLSKLFYFFEPLFSVCFIRQSNGSNRRHFNWMNATKL